MKEANQLDLFSILPLSAAVVAPDPEPGATEYPCDRCGTACPNATLAAPARAPWLSWCQKCRSEAAICCDCGTECYIGDFACGDCRAYALGFDGPDHYGDDR